MRFPNQPSRPSVMKARDARELGMVPKHRRCERVPNRKLKKFACAATIMLSLPFSWSSPAGATCPVPNMIVNGQAASAAEVSGNFDAIGNCAVAAKGSSAPGDLAIFSGVKSVTTGKLTGDVASSGGTATTLAPNGIAPGNYLNPNINVDAKGRITVAAGGLRAESHFFPNLQPGTASRTAANSPPISNILNGRGHDGLLSWSF